MSQWRLPRMVAALLLVAGLGYASAVAFRDGSGGDTVEDVTRILSTRGATISPEARTAMSERLVLAATRAPDDPSVHEQLGLMAMSKREPESASGAARHFRRAIELRPNSAYTWANLAAVQYRLGDTGPDFEKALIHAARLGPYEPEVQATVANFGLAVWPEASPELQSAVEQMVRAGMRRSPPEMLQIARRRGRLAIACHYLPEAPRQDVSKWSQPCQSLEATS